MAYRSPTSISRKSSHLISVTAPSMASSSASISQPVSPASGQNGMARTDQIIYRIYLKTVGVLVDGRLSQTQKGGEGDERERERRKDKWFNLVIPEVDIHKADIQVYKSISTYSAQDDSVPPLLVAFILDTSDIPTSQALIWNRASGKYTSDPSKIGKGKGKAKESRSGIVLERWTFQASAAEYLSEGSETAPYTAYRMGIIHFRALYSILRTLPAYNLYRKLRRSNSGLRLGMKLWAPEGYPDTEAGLKEAWEVMEQDLVGLDAGLDSLVSSESVEPEQDTRRYDLPPLELFGNEYSLSVDYRPEVDIAVEDLESVLSEKFVDMEEDWFTPTVARHRMGEGSNPSSVASSNPPSRRVATPTAIPSSNPAPIPHRQGPASIGSFQSGLGLGSRGRQVSSQSQKGTEPVSERWGAIGEGLPFATGIASENTKGSPSSVASGAAVAARRLSGHSIHPFTSASPSTSNLRGSPSPYAQGPSPTLAPRPSVAQSSSIGRTSSFLSRSGRSFTHAQLAHMYTGSTSPPVTGDMSREHLPLASSPNAAQPLVSPTSLSFSKQPLPRSVSGRQPSYTGSSPFIPSSLERENPMPPPALPHSQGSKRYPSSLGTSQGQRARVSSYGSSGGEGERTSQNLLRRSSTRMSTESGLRHSLEAPDRPATSVPDNDDIQSFLKTLDTLPQPPSLAAQASRARMPSASSSLSNTSMPHSPSILNPNSPSNNAFAGRAPVTRAQVDDAVKRMTGSFVVNTKTLEQSSVIPTESRGSTVSPPTRAPSVGLLSASRPVTSARRVSPAALGHGQVSVETSGISPSSVKRNSPLSGAPYPPAPTRSNPDPQAVKTSLPLNPPLPPPPPTSTIPRRSQSTARSLPAGPGLVADNSEQSAPISGFLSPQPTGPARSDARSTSNQRRGPVLLRGGFEGRSQSQFKTGSGQRQSTSPSRSPIRDYSRLGAVSSVGISSRAGGESQAEAELIGWRRYRSEQRIQLRARGAGEEEGIDENDCGVRPQNSTGVRRQSTGAGNVLGDAAKDRGGGAGQAQGQQTAPSSLGRYSPESD